MFAMQEYSYFYEICEMKSFLIITWLKGGLKVTYRRMLLSPFKPA